MRVSLERLLETLVGMLTAPSKPVLKYEDSGGAKSPKEASNDDVRVCPGCRGELRDLRDAVPFTVDALRERVCYRWADDEYTCVTRLDQKAGK
jgi:hypothetical protein